MPYGSRGTPVYTHLERTSQPMIRLVSGDLAYWQHGPNPCGRTYPRLPHGIFGRIDDMFTIRGENIYPSEIDAVLNAVPDYGGEHRILITRDGAMDELLLQVEIEDDARADATRLAAFNETVRHRLLKTLAVRAQIEVVASHSFPRTDFKGAPRDREPRSVPRHATEAGGGAAFVRACPLTPALSPKGARG